MTAPTVSVVVVSRGRPAALVRCLWGIEQLFFEGFELVVVADADGLAAIAQAGFTQIKAVAFDAPNISAARNLGLAEAAGAVVAFIDDDAVPEPTWLGALVEPFSDSRVAAAGGFVRGRNGISFQYIGAWVDTTGAEVAAARPGRHAPQAGRALKTMGTNCAFRRDALAALGGFDPAFRFYLDETDVNMRLARAGHLTALVAGAQVHHGFLASQYRDAARAPRDLFEIGASLAVFLRKHHGGDPEAAFDAERRAQWARLDRHFLAGRLEARDLRRLMRRLEEGFAAGLARDLPALRSLTDPSPFRTFAPRQPQQPPHAMQGRGRATRRAAFTAAGHGGRITLFSFSYTALYHRVRFERGVWIHSGGLFGRAERSEPLIQIRSRRSRFNQEMKRLTQFRGLTKG